MNLKRLLLSLAVGGFSAALHAAPKPLQVFILAGQTGRFREEDLESLQERRERCGAKLDEALADLRRPHSTQ